MTQDTCLKVTLFTTERSWHYLVSLTENGKLIAHVDGAFVDHVRFDQLQAFMAWIARATLKPRFEDDVFSPPYALTGTVPKA